MHSYQNSSSDIKLMNCFVCSNEGADGLSDGNQDYINNLRAEDARYISYAHVSGVCALFPDEVQPENILFLPPAVHNELLQTPRFRNLLPW